MLAEVFGRPSSLKQIYLHQSPTRESDELSLRTFMELSAYPDILAERKLIMSGAFSAPLRRRFWLPTMFRPSTSMFPVQHMFVQQRVNQSFWPNYYYLGDTMLQPEQFAAGFLRYLRSLVPRSHNKEQLYALVCGPPSLADIDQTRRVVSPLPAESFSIPVWPLGSTKYVSGPELVEVWPKVRDLEPQTWTVLVRTEKFVDTEADRRNPGVPFIYLAREATVVKYAFVRTRVRIQVDQLTFASDGRPLDHPGLDDLEVCTIGEFLSLTGATVDKDALNRRLQELVEYIAGIPRQPTLPSGWHHLSTMDHKDARAAMVDFLRDSVYMRRNLIKTMRIRRCK
jgi:hypothetical protein